MDDSGMGWLECLPQGCALVDRDLRVRAWNRQLVDWTGLVVEQAVGRPVDWFCPLLRQPLPRRRVLECIDSGLPAMFGAASQAPHLSMVGGHDRVVRCLVTRGLPVAGADTALLSFIDVSVDQHREAVIRDASRTAQQQAEELRQKEQELQQALEAAQTAAQTKQLFLANLGHEIRTPLNAIVGLGHLAERTDDPHRIRDLLTRVQDNARHLLDLLNNLLDLSKIEAGRLRIVTETFASVQLVERQENLFRLRAEAAGLSFATRLDRSMPSRVIGDRLRIEQVLTNLLANAFKFTTEGSIDLHLRWRVLGDRRGILTAVVRDTGPGIAAEDQERMFEAFSQGDDTSSRRHDGTGLGLAICRNLVELMDGRIELVSEPGVGSAFTVTLPLETAPADDGIKSGDLLEHPAAHADLLGRHVVLVCRPGPVADRSRDRLVALGARVDLAPDCDRAFDLMQDCDALVCERQSLEREGVEAVERLRQVAPHPDMPVVALVEELRGPVPPPAGVLATPGSLVAMLERGFRRLTDQGALADLRGIRGLDLHRCLACAGGSGDRARELLRRFVDSHRSLPARLDRDWQAGQLEAVRRDLHSLKGLGATLGLRTLPPLAEDLLFALQEDAEADPSIRLGCLQEELSLCCDTILERLPQQDEAASELLPADRQRITEAIARLTALLEGGDALARDAFLSLADDLRALLGDRDQVDRIGQAITRFDFPSAVELLAACPTDHEVPS